jgi:hypothetical protein
VLRDTLGPGEARKHRNRAGAVFMPQSASHLTAPLLFQAKPQTLSPLCSCCRAGAPSQAARDAAVLAVLEEFYTRRAKLLSRTVKHVVRAFPQDLPVPLVQQVLLSRSRAGCCLIPGACCSGPCSSFAPCMCRHRPRVH